MVSRSSATVPQTKSSSLGESDVRPQGTASLLLPKDMTLEFARSLLAFMNASGSRASYRLVIEEYDMLLERVSAN